MRTGMALVIGAAMAVTALPLTASAQEPLQDQEIIVKFRQGAARGAALTQSGARHLADSIGGAEVLATKNAEASIKALLARGDVEYAELNGRVEATAVPNDPLWPQQWHYWEPTGGIRLSEAWDIGVSGAGQRVAVLDTGRTWHPDLTPNYVGGYDMISSAATARDGGGRDADPTDEGDWTLDDQCAPGKKGRHSSWHGLHVAGTVAELRDNSVGGTGVAPLAKVVPVRVLGRCGGSFTDVAAGIVWAAGGSVPGVPGNPHPAKVINMSLGGPSATCPGVLQDAVNTARKIGASVVVSAGNDSQDASLSTPANCFGVVTTGATDRTADRAWYSNFGASVELCAPGGETSPDVHNGVLSTLNAGEETPGASVYGYYQGTSMAAPHVSGTIALMQHGRALVGKAPLTSDDVTKTLRATAMPATKGCGIGRLDAALSVRAAIGAP